MRFFTKEWVEAMQNNPSPEGFDIIEDREYSDEEIQEIYEAKLEEDIRMDEEFHNTPPDKDDYIFELEELSLEEVVIIYIDEDGEEIYRNPESLEELREYQEASYEQKLQEFEEREEYDREEYSELFEFNYQTMLNDSDYFPEWVFDEIDPRLVALNYLTEDLYNQLDKLSETADEYVQSVIDAYDEVYEQENIPEDILHLIDLHDANIEGIEEVDGDILFTVKPEHYDDEDDAETLVFENAKFLEFEEFNTESAEEFDGKTPTFFLYEEVYNSGDGYEFHFLLGDYSEEDPHKYLTIYADDIYLD